MALNYDRLIRGVILTNGVLALVLAVEITYQIVHYNPPAFTYLTFLFLAGYSAFALTQARRKDIEFTRSTKTILAGNIAVFCFYFISVLSVLAEYQMLPLGRPEKFIIMEAVFFMLVAIGVLIYVSLPFTKKLISDIRAMRARRKDRE